MQESGGSKLLKQSLRRSIRSSILALAPRVRAAEEAALFARLPTLPGYAAARTVLLYLKAFPEEIDTHLIVTQAAAAGKRVLCPRVDRLVRRLRLLQIGTPEASLTKGLLGIPEPGPGCAEVETEAVDWALIPGLAFDGRCNRLGRGGGYYDRLLPLLRPDAARWAIAYSCQLVSNLPVEPHDIAIDGVATACQEISRI
jgi:5-formyltetrahydrofolate cyclo-ligase